MAEQPIPSEEWRSIIANVPIVSVDLVVEYDGGILLGKRENEPARGEWFVPGGTVLKNEKRTDAVHRVAKEELGADVVVDEEIGTYEHFYDSSELDDVDSKHYLATAYRCHFESNNPEIVGDEQHGEIEVFRPPYDGLHPYVERYLQ